MKILPAISVVLITYNRSLSILKRALESVYSQTYSVSRIIIVDINTDPGLSSAISVYIKMLNRAELNLIQLPGKSNNFGRNCGAALAGGDYIAFLDDDDEWFPQKLESQVGRMDDNVSMVYSNYEIEKENNDSTLFYEKMPEIEGLSIRILGENIVGCTSIPLLSLKVFYEVGGFDESLRSNQEWDLWIRIIRKHNARYCPEIAGIKHHSRKSISNNRYRRADGWIRLLMKHAGLYRKNPEQFVVATGFFNGEMFNKKMYMTGTVALTMHILFKVIYQKKIEPRGQSLL